VELDIYERIMKTFEEGKPVRSMSFSEEEKKCGPAVSSDIKAGIVRSKRFRR